jgi:hypothetical protein
MSFPNLFQESANDWRPASLAFVDEIMPALDGLRAELAPNATTWVSEIAEDPGPAAGGGISDTLGGALWVGDVLGRYAEYQPGAVLRWLFKGSAIHKYGLVGEGDVPRPAYGAYWLYARTFGQRFVDAASTAGGEDAKTTVAVHAALREDGALTVMLVNKTSARQRVRVSLEGYAPCIAETFTLTGSDLDSTDFALEGEPFSLDIAKNGRSGSKPAPSALLLTELPPTSMRVVVYSP